MPMSALDLVAEAKTHITEIDLAAAQNAMQHSLLLDVREPAEFDAGHMPGAINIPRGLLEFKIGDHPQLSQRDRDILIYCKTSGRAALAALNLQRMGYSNVQSIHGGFDAWAQANLPIEREATQFGE
jgi:rhodanese-related sulfurtransferase